MNNSLKAAAILFGVSFLVQLTIGTSPIIPYHSYIIHGKVTRSPGLPLENITVRVLGKFERFYPDSLVSIDYLRAYSLTDQYPGVTDTSGWFHLYVVIRQKADSLILEATAVDSASARSLSFPAAQNSIEILSSTSEVQPGCGGCSTDEGSRTTYVAGYIYSFQDQTIPL